MGGIVISVGPAKEENDINYLSRNYIYQVMITENDSLQTNINSILVMIHPTANCQIASIAGVQNFIGRKDALEIFKKIHQSTGKKLVLIDVNSGGQDYKRAFEDKIDAMFEKERIIFKQFYRNSNDHKMLMYLLNIEDLK
jgi:hypothetical protein